MYSHCMSGQSHISLNTCTHDVSFVPRPWPGLRGSRRGSNSVNQSLETDSIIIIILKAWVSTGIQSVLPFLDCYMYAVASFPGALGNWGKLPNYQERL